MKNLSIWMLSLAMLLTGAARAQTAPSADKTPPAAAQMRVAVPPLTRHVTDLTATLSADEAQTLETRLTQFEQEKGAQIALLIVPTTGLESIEQYSMRVVEAWKLGRKKTDDGVLLIIAKNDRALRIEVGRGLEGALNDAVSSRIINETILPQFKIGAWYQGVSDGLDAITKVVSGESLPPPAVAPHAQGGNDDSILSVFFMVMMVAGLVLRMLLGSFFAALLAGGLYAGLAMIMGVSITGAVPVGLMLFAFVLFGGFSSGRGGSFGGGGFGGGGGGGGGGWSGGGGSFGGGGASGRW
jgi:uncharacterized protein